MTILFYLYNIVFTFLFVMYTKYQFIDEKLGFAHSKGLWHKYRLAMQVMAYIGPFIGFFVIPDTNYKDWLLCAAILWPFWDIGINILALGMPAFYDGSTSSMDKKLKGIKWFAYAVILIVAIVIKFSHA